MSTNGPIYPGRKGLYQLFISTLPERFYFIQQQPKCETGCCLRGVTQAVWTGLWALGKRCCRLISSPPFRFRFLCACWVMRRPRIPRGSVPVNTHVRRFRHYHVSFAITISSALLNRGDRRRRVQTLYFLFDVGVDAWV